MNLSLRGGKMLVCASDSANPGIMGGDRTRFEILFVEAIEPSGSGLEKGSIRVNWDTSPLQKKEHRRR